jgi:hypothetical protein
MSEFTHDSEFAQACIDGKAAVREWARDAPDEKLRNAFDQVSPTNAFTEILKIERDFRAARATEFRLKNVEYEIRRMQETLSRPERRTWVFWFTLIGVILAGLALLRDYLNVQRPDSAPSRAEPAIVSSRPSPVDPLSSSAPESPTSTHPPSGTNATAPTSEPVSK